MPAFEGLYSDDEMWHLIHYVQSLARPGEETESAPELRRDLSPEEEVYVEEWEETSPVSAESLPEGEARAGGSIVLGVLAVLFVFGLGSLFLFRGSAARSR